MHGSTWMLGQECWHSRWLWSPLLSCPHSLFSLSLLPPPQISTLGHPLRSAGDRSKWPGLIPAFQSGSSPSLMLRLGEERVVRETLIFIFFLSFQNGTKLWLCSLFFGSANGERSPIPTSVSQIAFFQTVKIVMIYFIFMAYSGLIIINSNLLLCFIVLGKNIVILTLYMCLI